jgi:sodium-dependent phosphate cotransporter
VAGRQAGEIFRNSEVFNNPVAGMLVGVLVTVLVQSSSTSTSIFITMVAADLLTVKQAIRLIMGANIGTSVTSTIVALGQSGNRNEFRRAFAAATVHDMFNFLCVLVLLPLEVITGYLFALSEALINATPGLSSGEKPPDILKKLTKPFTSKILKIDKKLITKIATGAADADDDGISMIKHIFGDESYGENGKDDQLVGVVVLLIALFVLCLTLYLIVYLLKSILKGHIAMWLHKSVNGEVPDIKMGTVTIPMGWVSGYMAMAVGLGLTICVQSSSITTSALTPLVGIGVLSVERMYPVVLGANIGTCITGVLAALAADASKLYLTLQVAYSHLFFNLTGIFIWYGIWPLRQFPIRAAKFLGNTTAEYRWFALAYLAVCFFILPAIFMAVAFAGDVPIIVLITLCVLAALFVAIVNSLQSRCPRYLPEKLRTWLWLPEAMRSLRPYDTYVFAPLGNSLSKCCSCFKSVESTSRPLKDVKGQAKELPANPDELAKAAERMA